jgi:hypothetical protein
MEVLSIVFSAVALVIAIAGVVVSYVVARKYGDVAGQKAARKFAEEQECTRALRILAALA